MKCELCGCTENLHVCLSHYEMKKIIFGLKETIRKRNLMIKQLREKNTKFEKFVRMSSHRFNLWKIEEHAE